jgi:CheY-like chemotaxis protein
MQPTTRNIVLCVDDDDALLQLHETALEAHGCLVMLARDGRQALRLAAARHLDAVILDYSMPDMNGGDVASELKRIQPNTPIILFSGSYDIPQSALQQVDAFVAKGEGLRPLLTVLQRLLQSSAETPAARRFPRYPVQVPFAVTVDRQGISTILHGMSSALGEGGIGGKIDGTLAPGEVVMVRISDSRLGIPLEPRAQVRYRKGGSYGLAFFEPSPEQQANVRRFCGQVAHI